MKERRMVREGYSTLQKSVVASLDVGYRVRFS